MAGLTRTAADRSLIAEIAEVATLAVRVHLRRGEPLIAGPLQSFAAAAWTEAHGAANLRRVDGAARRALRDLRGVRGSTQPRAFLDDVLAVLARRAARAAGPPAGGMRGLTRSLASGAGVRSMRMSDLCDMLGLRVRDPAARRELVSALRDAGIGTWPQPLPGAPHAWVRLVLREHPMALMVRGARTPGPRGDTMLRVGAALLPGHRDGGVSPPP